MPPPPSKQWKLAFTAEGKAYYYNRLTRTSQWEPPQDAVVVNMDQHPDSKMRSAQRDDDDDALAASSKVKASETHDVFSATPSRRLEFDVDTASKTLPHKSSSERSNHAVFGAYGVSDSFAKTISASDYQGVYAEDSVTEQPFSVTEHEGKHMDVDEIGGAQEQEDLLGESNDADQTAATLPGDQAAADGTPSSGVKAALITLLNVSPDVTTTLFAPSAESKRARPNI